MSLSPLSNQAFSLENSLHKTIHFLIFFFLNPFYKTVIYTLYTFSLFFRKFKEFFFWRNTYKYSNKLSSLNLKHHVELKFL